MKSSQQQLHTLIHALDRGEKRAFRKFAKRHVVGENNFYLDLFSALEAQPVYDARELEQLWGKAQPARRLPVVKNYLLKLVLKSLRQQQTGQTLSMYLREQLDDIEMLLAKGQGELCARWIRRTRKKATLLGETLPLLSLIRWEKRLLRWQAGPDLPRRMDALVAEESACVQALQEETALQGVRDRMFAIIVQQLNPRAPKVRDKLEELMRHPLLSAPPNQLSLEGQLAYRFVFAYYFHMRGEYKKLVDQYREMFTIWNAWPDKQKWEEQRYINTLYLYLDSCYLAAEFDEFEIILPKIRQFKPRRARNQALQFHLLHHLLFRYYLNSGQFEAAKPMESDIARGLKQHATQLNPNIVLSFYHNLAVLFFILEDYQKGLHWLNQLIHFPHLATRPDLQTTSRILHIIFHFERGNYELLDNLLASSRRYLRTRVADATYEQSLLTGLRRLADAPLSEQAQLWQSLRAEITEIGAQIEVPILAAHEIQAWLESKTSGKKMADILRSSLSK